VKEKISPADGKLGILMPGLGAGIIKKAGAISTYSDGGVTV
jgi:hypothetical protein